MSYTFSILSPLDVPLFTHDFGTSRSGGDGVARFTPSERALVPFILHSALDIVEEVQWGNNGLCVISHTSIPATSGLTLIEKLSQEH